MWGLGYLDSTFTEARWQLLNISERWKISHTLPPTNCDDLLDVTLALCHGGMCSFPPRVQQPMSRRSLRVWPKLYLYRITGHPCNNFIQQQLPPETDSRPTTLIVYECQIQWNRHMALNILVWGWHFPSRVSVSKICRSFKSLILVIILHIISCLFIQGIV